MRAVLSIIAASVFIVVSGESKVARLETLPSEGYDENILRAPYHAAVFVQFFRVCSGTVIHPMFILTAAQCTWLTPVNDILVKVGVDDIRTGKLRKVMEYIIHPSFNATTLNYDIALLRLRRPLEFGERIRAVRINEKFDLSFLYSITTSGWTRVSSENDSQVDPNRLKVATSSNVVNPAECRDRKMYFPVTGLCIRGGIPDVGSPAIMRATFIGIYSRPSSGQNGDLAVYTTVGRMKQWIFTTISDILENI